MNQAGDKSNVIHYSIAVYSLTNNEDQVTDLMSQKMTISVILFMVMLSYSC